MLNQDAKQIINNDINDILSFIETLKPEYSLNLNGKNYVKFLQLQDKIKVLSERINTLEHISNE